MQQKGLLNSNDQLQAKMEGWLLKQKASGMGGWKRRYRDDTIDIHIEFQLEYIHIYI